MPLQTSVSFEHQKRMKGTATYFLTQHKYTGYATTEIDFGIGLAYNTGSTDTRMNVKVPTAVADTFLGVSMFVHKQRFEKPDPMTMVDSSVVLKYDANEPITYLRKGTIAVYSEVAVNPSSPVFWRTVTNGTLTAGNFRNDADTNRAVQLTNARWVESITAAGLVLLELDY